MKARFWNVFRVHLQDAFGHPNLWHIAVACVFIFHFAVLVRLEDNLSVDVDDAFITFRYANNIVAGHGYSFNPGEQAWGSTTPLYVFLLAAAKHIFGIEPHQAAPIVGIAAAMLGLYSLLILAIELVGRWQAFLAAAVFASFAPIAFCAVSGMETSVFIFFIIRIFLNVSRARDLRAGVYAALSLWTRPDAAIPVLAIIFAILARQGLRRALLFALIALCGYLPWLLYAVLKFGTVVPQTLVGKLNHEITADRWWALCFLNRGQQQWLTFAAVIGIPVLMRRGIVAVAMMIWVLFHIVIYLASQMPEFDWYMAPLSPVFAISASAGIVAAGNGILKTLSAHSRLATNLLFGILCALCLLNYLISGRNYLGIRVEFMRYLWVGVEDVAGWIKENTRREAVVDSSSLGTTGYFSERRMFDPYEITSNNQFAPGLSPDILVRTRPSKEEGATFSGYQRLRSFPGGPRSTHDLYVRDMEVLK